MTATLSVVEAIWNLPAAWLDCNLNTLSHQTQPPMEIVVTNASSDPARFEAAERVCAKYPLVRMIVAKQEKFNLSHALNVGIKASQGTYTMLTSIDRLFAPNYVEQVYKLMAPNLMVTSTSRNLPIGFDLGDPDTFYQRWPDILAQSAKTPKFVVGTIICVEREWLMKVHGLDEDRCPLLYCDSDLILRGGKDGWDETQRIDPDLAPVLHIGHPSRLGAGFGGKLPDKNLPVVRNLNGWGET